MNFFKKLFLMFGLSGILIFNSSTQCEAKIVTDKLPLLTYAETPISVYDKPNGNKKGTIAAGSSLVLVKVIRPDGWAYGSYKVDNQKKRPYRWFKMEELQGYADFENYIDKAISDQDAYRTRTSGSLVGKIAGDEDLIVVAKRGDKIKVIFKADGNFYRMGWVGKFSLSKTSSESSNGDTTSLDTLPLEDSFPEDEFINDDLSGTENIIPNDDFESYEE